MGIALFSAILVPNLVSPLPTRQLEGYTGQGRISSQQPAIAGIERNLPTQKRNVK